MTKKQKPFGLGQIVTKMKYQLSEETLNGRRLKDCNENDVEAINWREGSLPVGR